MLSVRQRRAVAFAGSAGKPYPALANLVRALREPPIDHLILGDSVVERVSKWDEDRRTLGEMIAGKVAPQSVAVISRQGQHPILFEGLLRAARTQPGRPRRSIILPVNMRCFSPQWDLNPKWQFEQELRVLSRYIERPRETIRPIEDVLEDPRAMQRYGRTGVVYPMSPYAAIGDFLRVISVRPESEDGKLARWRDIFIFHYGYPLSVGHRKLKALASAAGVAAGLAAHVLVYITPLDVAAMEQVVGGELVNQVRTNIEVVSSALQGQLIDWSEAVPQGDFFSWNHPTEHLNERGRAKLADLVAGQIANR